jgi:hypothetical protein
MNYTEEGCVQAVVGSSLVRKENTVGLLAETSRTSKPQLALLPLCTFPGNVQCAVPGALGESLGSTRREKKLEDLHNHHSPLRRLRAKATS